uniref:tyrosine-type recombinase/integrase n=1 Tax=Aliarcobacter sp. TaxID=2321116 RepID=UPI0040474FC7
MSRTTKPLSDTEIKTSKPKDKDYKLSDGQGLYIVIKTNGTKMWRFDYKFNDKRKSMSFGTYPNISLKEAREKREETKSLLNKKIDPIAEKKKSNSDTSFKNICETWFDLMRKKEWEEITYNKNRNRFINHIYPVLGETEIKEVSRKDILKIAQKLEELEYYEVLSRVINTMERIFKYAVSYDIVEHNIIADIDKRATRINKSSITHLAAVTKPNEIKNLMQDIKDFGELYNSDVSTVLALELLPYVFLRPSNIRHLEWDEVNYKKNCIEIPGEKMKTKKDFVLPLSSQAKAIIERIKPYSYNSSKFVFPSPTTNLKAISDATLSHALQKLGYKNKHCPHGFRSMFSTTAHEHISEHSFSSDIIESCLAHVDRNNVRSSYNRESKYKYFEEKKELVQWYADWLDNLN